VESPGSVSSGRHRKSSETPTVVVLRVTAAFIVVGLATVAGVASFQGPTQRPSIAAATPVQVAPAKPAGADPRNIAAPIGSHAAAYLNALQREDISVVDIPTLLLVADSVCARQGDTTVPAQAERLMAAFPGRWRPQQAAVIVDSAIKLVCDDTALRGAIVNADVHPAK
jgi:hypothetical protein